MKSPAFQFYAAEWISDEHVSMMSLEEEGAYIRLLAYCWREGSISADPQSLSRLCKGASTTLLTVVLKRFKQHPSDASRLVHSRLDIEREKQAAWREKSAKGGRQSGKARAATSRKVKRLERDMKGGSTKQQADPLSQTPTLQSSSSSSSTSTQEKKEVRRADKPRDPRIDHPSIKAVYEIRGSYPLKDMWNFVIEAVGDAPDKEKLRECWKAWRGHSHNPQDLAWILDWYVNGIPEHKKFGGRNGNNQTRSESSTERNARNLRENVAYIRSLSESDSPTDSESSVGLLTSGARNTGTSGGG